MTITIAVITVNEEDDNHDDDDDVGEDTDNDA